MNTESVARETSHSPSWLGDIKATIASVYALDPTGASLLVCDTMTTSRENEREVGKRNASFVSLFLSKERIVARRTKAEQATKRMIFQLKQKFIQLLVSI